MKKRTRSQQAKGKRQKVKGKRQRRVSSVDGGLGQTAARSQSDHVGRPARRRGSDPRTGSGPLFRPSTRYRQSSRPLYNLAEGVGGALKRRGVMLVTAESCTGGWVAEAITMVPGSSEWFERGFVTYTHISKREMLGVGTDTLGTYGAVSEQTVREMVTGALARSHAQIALAVSGVAGPGGGTAEKPVGTVCFAWGVKDGAPGSETRQFSGDREAVRRQSVEHALRGVLALLARK